MSRVAVVKPDHLGDLVLASPAIRAIKRSFGNATLFVGTACVGLAEHLFPGTEIGTVDFPHLTKGRVVEFRAGELAERLRGFDHVFWLRDDEMMRNEAALEDGHHDFADGDHLTHETILHKRMLSRHLPAYSRTALFSKTPIGWPEQPRRIGLCISAGFPTNRWPNVYWIELATRLIRSGLQVTLIGGPNERTDLLMLSRLLKALPHSSIVGGRGFGEFSAELADLDLIVASDGGTAHLCSLTKPVLSIFGSSPWRRYAPFGRDNILLTRDLSCSPCLQFSSEEVNGCLTRECGVGLIPSFVEKVIAGARDADVRAGILVQRGTSHHALASS